MTEDTPIDTDRLALERTHLAAERTFFAVLRTGLAIAGAGTVIVAILGDSWPQYAIFLTVALQVVLGIVLILFLVGLLTAS